MSDLGPCHVCDRPVKPEYSVLFRWWDDTEVVHPSCIQTFAVGRPVSPHLKGQAELFSRPEERGS